MRRIRKENAGLKDKKTTVVFLLFNSFVFNTADGEASLFFF